MERNIITDTYHENYPINQNYPMFKIHEISFEDKYDIECIKCLNIMHKDVNIVSIPFWYIVAESRCYRKSDSHDIVFNHALISENPLFSGDITITLKSSKCITNCKISIEYFRKECMFVAVNRYEEQHVENYRTKIRTGGVSNGIIINTGYTTLKRISMQLNGYNFLKYGHSVMKLDGMESMMRKFLSKECEDVVYDVLSQYLPNEIISMIVDYSDDNMYYYSIPFGVAGMSDSMANFSAFHSIIIEILKSNNTHECYIYVKNKNIMMKNIGLVYTN